MEPAEPAKAIESVHGGTFEGFAGSPPAPVSKKGDEDVCSVPLEVAGLVTRREAAGAEPEQRRSERDPVSERPERGAAAPSGEGGPRYRSTLGRLLQRLRLLYLASR